MSKNAPKIVSLQPPAKDAAKIVNFVNNLAEDQLALLPDEIAFTDVVRAGGPRAVYEQYFAADPEKTINGITTKTANSNGVFVTSSTTNTMSLSVGCPFLALAICNQIVTDHASWSITGQTVPRPVSGQPTPNTPALAAAAAYGSPYKPATFSKGSTNLAKLLAMNIYGLRILLGCNYELADISWASWGEALDSDANGLGTATLSVQEEIAALNAALAAAGDPSMFIPQTYVPGCTDAVAGTPLPPPLVPVQQLGQRTPGMYGGCFALPSKMVLVPQLNFEIVRYIRPNTQFLLNALIDALSSGPPRGYSDEVSGIIAQQRFIASPKPGVTFVAQVATCTEAVETFTEGQAIVGSNAQPLVRFDPDGTGAYIARSIYGGMANATPVGAGTILDPSLFDITACEQFIGYSDTRNLKAGYMIFSQNLKGMMITLKAALDFFLMGPAKNANMVQAYSESQNALAGLAMKAGFTQGLAGLGDVMSIEQAQQLASRIRE